jgi:transposase-like protein
MRDEAVKVFSREFKQSTLRRMLSGENVSALARELRKITGVIVYLKWEPRARRRPRGRGARRRFAVAVDEVLRAEPDEDEG